MLLELPLKVIYMNEHSMLIQTYRLDIDSNISCELDEYTKISQC